MGCIEGANTNELRCKACEILGGLTVESDEQVDELSAIPRVRVMQADAERLAIEEGREWVPLQVGDVLSLPPCLPKSGLPGFQKEHGRPCPRVELDPENRPACSLFTLLAREQSRPIAYPLFMEDARERGWPREKRTALMRRAADALLDPEIAQAQRPKPPK